GVTCSGHGTCAEDPVRCECDAGYVASGVECVPDVVPSAGDLFVDLPAVGLVVATLHPTESATLGAPTIVSFGAPFPRGAVADAGSIRVTTTAGVEIPAHVEELARWRSLSGAAAFPESVRSALVQLSMTFSSRDPVEVQVHWGAAPASSPARMGDPWSTWTAIDASTFFPSEYPASAGVREPPVLATFPASWLGACILRTRTEPFGTDAGWAFFDDVYPQFARTGVNDVDPRVTAGNRIDYVTEQEPWLFQRALTLFGAYVRSGDVAWLRHAHRAAQFYAAHLTAGGHLDLAPGDLKYAYGGALFVDLMLTGDTRHLPRIEAVARAGAGWNETYAASTGFWTERHQTYALLAALIAWEATGGASHSARAREVATETFRMAREPVSGWAAEGCLLHTSDSHEGDGRSERICSPWMSALLGDAVFRYYVHSEDDDALEFLAGLADFVRTTGSAPDGAGISPYYLVSSVTRDAPDIEHACDVAGLVARGAWSRRALGSDDAALLATARGLLTNCRANLESWHRPGGPAAGLAEWRLSPPRKLNWWFGSTLDLPWLIAAP
nr:EGF-like domain-containing protein [Myxococcota bacterium]